MAFCAELEAETASISAKLKGGKSAEQIEFEAMVKECESGAGPTLTSKSVLPSAEDVAAPVVAEVEAVAEAPAEV